MLKVRYGRRFKKEFQKMLQRQGHTCGKFNAVLEYLINEKTLPPECNDHALRGDYVGYRECHIMPDWLLIYKVAKDTLTLVLVRTGSHSDLFR